MPKAGDAGDKSHRAMCSIQPMVPNCPPLPYITACSEQQITGVSRLCLGWVSAQPMSRHQPQGTQETQSPGQRVEFGGCNVGPEAEPPGSAVREGPSRAAGSSTGKGRVQLLCCRAEPGPKHPPGPEGIQGWVPSCCSPGRVPCRTRAASPRGWPCPPSWGRKAGGTTGTGGMVPAGMVGGTPHRTCRGRGHGLEVTGQIAPAHTGQLTTVVNCVFLKTVFRARVPLAGWVPFGSRITPDSFPAMGFWDPELQLWLSRTCAAPWPWSQQELWLQ